MTSVFQSFCARLALWESGPGEHTKPRVQALSLCSLHVIGCAHCNKYARP